MKTLTSGFSYSALAVCSLAVLADDTDPSAQQLEPMVVSATRTETPIKQVGSAITVITAKDIADRRSNTVAEILRGVPGLDVQSNGGIGQPTSVFLRGANSGHTLVLIDGIEMNDPSSTSNAFFNYSDLQVDNIERIEILRGAQSSVYGSDAIGGVINIITKRTQGKPQFRAEGQGGSYDSFKLGGGVDGGSDALNYGLSASRLETQGFSAADRRLGNTERDGYRNSTVTSRLGAQPRENLDLDWNLRFQEGKAQFDDCGGARCDDPNAFSVNKQLFTRGQGRLKLFDGFWEQTFGIAYSLTDRRTVDLPDTVSPFGNRAASRNAFEGDKVKVNWQSNFNLHETNTAILGVENEADRIVSASDRIGVKSANTTGYYLQDQISLWNRWFTTAGVRFDEHNRVGGKVTWRITQVFAFDETGTRLKGSYGTGFKAPSLYQLFAPPAGFGPVGNPNLSPETSQSWDAGFEQSLWKQKAGFGASYFNNVFNNLIDFRFGQGYLNIDLATAEGIESFFEIKPLEGLSLRGNYTYTRTHDASTRARLFNRPTHKGSFDAHYRFLQGADVNVNILLVGSRDFQDFSTFPERRVALSGYALVNLAGSYDINRHLRLFARVDNLLDKNYQEILGYGTSGLAGYAGFSLNY